MTADFFRARLDQMIDLKHPLAVLAQRMPWAQIETAMVRKGGAIPLLFYGGSAGKSALAGRRRPEF